MTDQEIEAAAELWAGFAAGGYYETAPNMATATMRAGMKLADWAVARLAAERAEREERERPIDEEWLRSIGFANETINGLSRLFDCWPPSGKSGSVCEMFLDQHGTISICQDDDLVVLTMMRPVATRGRLLDLLAALGVDTKGGA